MNEELTKAWGEWLSGFPWQAWCTLTFREERSHASATRAFQRFGNWIQKAGSPEAGWFFAHEIGRWGRLHLHALLGGIESWPSRRALWKWWYEKYGRAEVLPFDPRKGAVFYVSKYVTKGELSHYDIQRPGGQLSLLPAFHVTAGGKSGRR